MTIAENLLAIIDTKEAIKTSITNKGVDLTDVPFTDYPLAIDSITTGGVEEWVRPPDWLPLPSVLPTEQKFVGLFAVFDNEANSVAFVFSGAYIVDWGDGVIENYASGTKASHLYSYANISNTTLSSRGYKQVIITVTPQAGQNLTVINLKQTHQSYTNAYSIKFLELKMSLPSVVGTNLTFNVSSPDFFYPMIECVDIVAFGISSLNYTFKNMFALQKVVLPSVVAITEAASTFQNCYSLRKLPDLNFSGLKNALAMFSGCRLLTSVSNLVFGSQLTNTTNMFYGCTSLEVAPELLTSSVTNMGYMFNGCSALKRIPLYDTSNVTDMGAMMNGCSSLLEIPNFNTSKVTIISAITSSAFGQCSSLIKIPDLDLSKVTANPYYLFDRCYALQEIGNISLAGVTGTNTTSMFNNCYSLSKCGISGLAQTFSIANCSLPATELNRIFTNLPTVATSKTITVTGNPGAATCDTTIATVKNWVVVR